ncbi:MAG: 16S rRNA (guanine(527)-N(7))-methyltransferase RsmG, partial [Tannerella sp.]|nr:16S rRNA (guanine(527)-N(7))-methyltransferase RsmG [Tannerella sp.]
EQKNALPNGLICLKGGELQHETAPFRKQFVCIDLPKYYNEPFFETKKVIYIPI